MNLKYILPLLVTPLAFANDTPNIVYINQQYIITKSPALKKAGELSKNKYQKQIDSVKAKILPLQAQLKTASGDKKDKINLQISQLNDSYNSIIAERDNNLKAIRMQYGLVEESAINMIRKEHKYSYILDRGYVWSADPALDVSDQVAKLADSLYNRTLKK